MSSVNEKKTFIHLIHKRTLLLGAGVLALSIVLISVFSLNKNDGQLLGSPGAEKLGSTESFRITGLNYTGYEKGKMIYRISGDEVKVAKRKFGIFYINPLREAFLSNLYLEVYTYSEQKPNREFIAAQTQKALLKVLPVQNLKELGAITRIKIDGMKLDIFQDSKLVSSINSRFAVIDPKARSAQLSGPFSISTSEGRSLFTEGGQWDQNTGTFITKNFFILNHGGKISHGKHLKFDFQLQEVKS